MLGVTMGKKLFRWRDRSKRRLLWDELGDKPKSEWTPEDHAHWAVRWWLAFVFVIFPFACLFGWLVWKFDG